MGVGVRGLGAWRVSRFTGGDHATGRFVGTSGFIGAYSFVSASRFISRGRDTAGRSRIGSGPSGIPGQEKRGVVVLRFGNALLEFGEFASATGERVGQFRHGGLQLAAARFGLGDVGRHLFAPLFECGHQGLQLFRLRLQRRQRVFGFFTGGRQLRFLLAQGLQGRFGVRAFLRERGVGVRQFRYGFQQFGFRRAGLLDPFADVRQILRTCHHAFFDGGEFGAGLFQRTKRSVALLNGCRQRLLQGRKFGLRVLELRSRVLGLRKHGLLLGAQLLDLRLQIGQLRSSRHDHGLLLLQRSGRLFQSDEARGDSVALSREVR